MLDSARRAISSAKNKLFKQTDLSVRTVILVSSNCLIKSFINRLNSSGLEIASWSVRK